MRLLQYIELIFLKLFQKFYIKNFKNAIKAMNDDDIIFVKWSESSETKDNFGDALNPWLIEKLTGLTIVNATKTFNFRNKTVYSFIGSVLDRSRFNNLVVYGSGFKSDKSDFIGKGMKVHAVRGPLTRNRLIEKNIKCPEVYGDPALLLPLFYYPKVEKRYKIGIIPHYIDKKDYKIKNIIEKTDVNFKIIDIEDDIQTFIDNVLSCELIASSSLHGLIVSDAYSIPSLYVKFSDNVSGGNFKFKDYMLSVGRDDYNPYVVTDESTLEDMILNFSKYEINIDLKKLLEASPFNNKV